jgi:hypothetical protein
MMEKTRRVNKCGPFPCWVARSLVGYVSLSNLALVTASALSYGMALLYS